ncbi:DUF1971 domain-containing protein, partial [Paraburkholderia aspalathi]|nr:DUF1971 domain-containing protein [Paraburkholderia aspalathi]
PETLPEKLRTAHTTEGGAWALLHILEGKIFYQLCHKPQASSTFQESLGFQHWP